MRILFIGYLVLATSPACAWTEEDAAHRADRLRTQQLNRSAAASIASRDRGQAARADTYRAAQDRYERERAAWRRRFDACQAGDWSACQ